jgi:hypothetical protein
LKEETIDIYNYISGKDALPDHLKNLPIMKVIQAYALEKPMASPETYAKVKKETNHHNLLKQVVQGRIRVGDDEYLLRGVGVIQIHNHLHCHVSLARSWWTHDHRQALNNKQTK